MGGRRRSLSGVARRRQQTVRAQDRVEKLEEQIAQYEIDLEERRDAYQKEVDSVRAKGKKRAADLEELRVKLEKDDIELQEISVLWIPL